MGRVREESRLVVAAIVVASRTDANGPSVTPTRGAKESVVERLPIGVEGVARHLAHVHERVFGGSRRRRRCGRIRRGGRILGRILGIRGGEGEEGAHAGETRGGTAGGHEVTRREGDEVTQAERGAVVRRGRGGRAAVRHRGQGAGFFAASPRPRQRIGGTNRANPGRGSSAKTRADRTGGARNDEADATRRCPDRGAPRAPRWRRGARGRCSEDDDE